MRRMEWIIPQLLFLVSRCRSYAVSGKVVACSFQSKTIYQTDLKEIKIKNGEIVMAQEIKKYNEKYLNGLITKAKNLGKVLM